MKIENTNHAGIYFDDDQLEWLANTVCSSNAKTSVLFTHEPLANNDSTLVRKQLSPILEKFRGKHIWNFCGHDHSNTDYKYVRTPDINVYKKKESHNIFVVEVPSAFPSGDMFVEIYNNTSGNIRIGGYALLG